MKRYKWLSLILSLVVLVNLVGCGSDSSESSSTSLPISISASALSRAFEKDEDAALEEYKGKTLEITGTVEVSTASTIKLDRENADGNIICKMSSDNHFDMDTIKVGDVVRIRGELLSGSNQINLKNCYCLDIIRSSVSSSEAESEVSSQESSSEPEERSEPSSAPESSSSPAPAPAPSSEPSQPKVSSSKATAPDPEPQGQMVWIPKTGKKYHSNPNCSNMKDPSQVSIETAKARGYTACKKCY